MAEHFNGQDCMTLDAVRELIAPEEAGFDAPFATFTWQHWLEVQATIPHCFSRFLRAVEEKRADQVLMIGLEVQEVANQMLLEAYAMTANLPLEELPALARKKEC